MSIQNKQLRAAKTLLELVQRPLLLRWKRRQSRGCTLGLKPRVNRSAPATTAEEVVHMRRHGGGLPRPLPILTPDDTAVQHAAQLAMRSNSPSYSTLPFNTSDHHHQEFSQFHPTPVHKQQEQQEESVTQLAQRLMVESMIHARSTRNVGGARDDMTTTTTIPTTTTGNVGLLQPTKGPSRNIHNSHWDIASVHVATLTQQKCDN